MSVALTGVKVLNKDNWWPEIVKNSRLPVKNARLLAAYKPSVVFWLWSTLKSSSRQNCCTNINNTLSSHSLGGQRIKGWYILSLQSFALFVCFVILGKGGFTTAKQLWDSISFKVGLVSIQLNHFFFLFACRKYE